MVEPAHVLRNAKAFDVVFREGELRATDRAISGLAVAEWGDLKRVELGGERALAEQRALGLFELGVAAAWVVPVVYRGAVVSIGEAEATARLEFQRLSTDEPNLVFEGLQQAQALGNPLTWAFATLVHHRDRPQEDWRRYVQVDRLSGLVWDLEASKEYLRLVITPVASTNG